MTTAIPSLPGEGLSKMATAPATITNAPITTFRTDLTTTYENNEFGIILATEPKMTM